MVVIVREKGLLPTIPPLGDMMREASNHHSAHSCHPDTVAELEASVN
jgi:hypothetical protein